MCRYAFKTYKSHYACFDCRKTFKRPPLVDLAKQNGDLENLKKTLWNRRTKETKKFRKENPELVKTLEDRYVNKEEKCPDCGKAMAHVGLDLRVPKRHKVKEWKILEGLYKSGRSFSSCGCNGIGSFPKTMRNYKAELLRTKARNEWSLSSRNAKSKYITLKDYIERYSQRIEKIDAELSKL